MAGGPPTGLHGWLHSRQDPVRAHLLSSGPPDLDTVFSLFPRTAGDPALEHCSFDPDAVAARVAQLRTDPAVNTGHPLLDLSVRTGLAHIDLTLEHCSFVGDHPRYGAKSYAAEEHDGFPPTIIAAVDALSAWGLGGRAAQLLTYWLRRFVRGDGTINYYGASISEYGQLLHTAALVAQRARPDHWWRDCSPPLSRIAAHLLKHCFLQLLDDALSPGSPEADTRDQVGKYFHNNAWVARGLRRWADLGTLFLCVGLGASPSPASRGVQTAAGVLKHCFLKHCFLARDLKHCFTLSAIKRTWPRDPDDWWLPPKERCSKVEPEPHPAHLTDGAFASYTNYRYWPELLSSGLLPPDLANRLVGARLSAGGQFCGMTRFFGHLDDWPLADYLKHCFLFALWSLGRREDFLLSLYGHLSYHQAEGHLTAYEQVSFPPGREVTPYCLPCQLVPARTARLLGALLLGALLLVAA